MERLTTDIAAGITWEEFLMYQWQGDFARGMRTLDVNTIQVGRFSEGMEGKGGVYV